MNLQLKVEAVNSVNRLVKEAHVKFSQALTPFLGKQILDSWVTNRLVADLHAAFNKIANSFKTWASFNYEIDGLILKLKIYHHVLRGNEYASYSLAVDLATLNGNNSSLSQLLPLPDTQCYRSDWTIEEVQERLKKLKALEEERLILAPFDI